MRERLRLRVPTGITSLDPLLDGGAPPGSVVLLLGEHGAHWRQVNFERGVSFIVLMTPIP